MERIVAGIEKKSKILSPIEKEIVSYHEMGHALVGYQFNKEDKIHKVSIIPHGIGAMGYTIQNPTEDRYLLTKEELQNKMAVLLAGRASEMLIFNKLSTGASDDLDKATSIAREMVMRFGMAPEIGFVTFGESSNQFLEIQGQINRQNYSEETAREIDHWIKEIIMNAYEKAFNFLKNERDILIEASETLMEKETLGEDELNVFFEKIQKPLLEDLTHH
jgi:cell division protease FtsH